MSEPPTNLHRAKAHDVLEAARSWLDKDGRVALATVVGTWGSAPVGVGGQMVVAQDGRFEGSVSGGCVEGEVIAEAEDILASGKPKTLEFGVADETAWQVGLPCGGQIKVFVERLEKSDGLPLITRALDARTNRRGLVVRTRLADGRHELFGRDDKNADASHPPAASTAARASCMETPDGEVFVHAMVPPARVLIIGATHIGQILAQLVKIAGYEVIVIDPRTAFAAEARFPGIRLDTEWPQDTHPQDRARPLHRGGGAGPRRPHRRRGPQARHALGLLLRRRAGLQAQPRQAHRAPEGRRLQRRGDQAHPLADRHQHRRPEPAGDRHLHHGRAGARLARAQGVQAGRRAAHLIEPCGRREPFQEL